ncbi:MAG TPA: hypothetical protein VEP50_18230 [bacterium]|nr:hypothetical protein [bacterium]
MESLFGEQGKCGTCGYLGQRAINPVFGTELREVNEPQRAGRIDILEGVTLSCYLKAADLEREYPRPTAAQPVRAIVRSILDKHRKCPKWDPYLQQFNPKEHFQFYQQQQFARQMERNLRTFEEQLERSRRQFELQLQADNRRFQRKLALIAVFAVAFVALAYPFMPMLYTALLKAGIARVLGF